jgi:hypothetical protein
MYIYILSKMDIENNPSQTEQEALSRKEEDMGQNAYGKSENTNNKKKRSRTDKQKAITNSSESEVKENSITNSSESEVKENSITNSSESEVKENSTTDSSESETKEKSARPKSGYMLFCKENVAIWNLKSKEEKLEYHNRAQIAFNTPKN